MTLKVTFYVSSKWHEDVTLDNLVSILELHEYLLSDDGSLNDLLLYQDAARDAQASGGACPLQISAPSSAAIGAPLAAASVSLAPAHVPKAPAPPTSVASLPRTDSQASAPIGELHGRKMPAQLDGEAGNSKD